MREQRTKFRRTVLWQIAAILLCGMAVRLIIAALYVHKYDLVIYNIPWALGVREDLFGAYGNIKNLNYPPLFPFLLHFVGDGIAAAEAAGNSYLVMLLVKLFPVVFDGLLMIFAFFFTRSYWPERKLQMLVLWAANVSIILNSSVWGQTDSMLLFFIALLFVALERRQAAAAGICFALGCLTKLQMAYLAPVFLLELCFHFRWKKSLLSLAAGGATGLLGWLPFMIRSGRLLLPLDIYLGGANTYKYVSMCSANIYGIFNYNAVRDTERIVSFLPLTFAQLNLIFTVLIFAGLFAGYLAVRKRGGSLPAAFHALMYMDAVFMFSTRMHERYQLPVVILSFLCAVFLRDKVLLLLHLAFTGVTFFNQAAGFFNIAEGGVFSRLMRPVQSVCSVINVLLFAALVALYVVYIMKKRNPYAGGFRRRAPFSEKKA